MVYFLSHRNDEVYSYNYRALDGDVSKIQAADLTRDVGVRIRPGYTYIVAARMNPSIFLRKSS